MSIRSICKDQVVAVKTQANIQEVAKLMDKESVGCLVVMEEENESLGIITDRDIALRVVAQGKNAQQLSAKDIMNDTILTISEVKGINDAIQLMQEKGVRRIPVLNKDKHLCGIVTADDLLVMLAVELDGLAKLAQHQAPPNAKKLKTMA